MGNLTRDPELRVTPSGFSICKFGIAVNRTFTTQDGNQREETTFVDIDAFGKQGEVIAKYFNRGKPILVEGRLRLDQWETNTGDKRSKLGVVLERFEFVGVRSDGDQASSDGNSPYEQSAPPQRSTSSAPASPPPVDEDIDDDVPF